MYERGRELKQGNGKIEEDMSPLLLSAGKRNSGIYVYRLLKMARV
jgi:hypothetical protein